MNTNKPELYRKVFIKSKEDLPTKQGEYFVQYKPNKKEPFTAEKEVKHFGHGDSIDAIWRNCVDWYLRPIESEEPEQCTKCDAEGWIHTNLGDVMEHTLCDCGKWKDQPKQEVKGAEEILEALCTRLYDSKLCHDYKDGKIDYRIISMWFKEQTEWLNATLKASQKQEVNGSERIIEILNGIAEKGEMTDELTEIGEIVISQKQEVTDEEIEKFIREEYGVFLDETEFHYMCNGAKWMRDQIKNGK